MPPYALVMVASALAVAASSVGAAAEPRPVHVAEQPTTAPKMCPLVFIDGVLQPDPNSPCAKEAAREALAEELQQGQPPAPESNKDATQKAQQPVKTEHANGR
jgi:hypothetical protein